MKAQIVEQIEFFSEAELESLEFLPEELEAIEEERVPDLDSISFEDIAEDLEAVLEGRRPGSPRPGSPRPGSRPSSPSRPPPPRTLRYLQVSKLVLGNRGWKLQQGNAFWPANNSINHIHLGVSSNHDGRIAEDGNAFVTYVSIKQNDRLYERLIHDPQTGYFSSRRTLPNGYGEKLRELGILR